MKKKVVMGKSSTGGLKEIKLEQYSLIPVDALRDIARVYGHGAGKYARNNWRRGYNWSWSYDSLQRHLNSFWEGEWINEESGLPHLAHAGFHILSLLTFGKEQPRFDDRWKSSTETGDISTGTFSTGKSPSRARKSGSNKRR